jgi:hypothetical protein
MPPIPSPKPERKREFTSGHDFGELFGIRSAEETQEALAENDFINGWKTASVMALTIDKQIRDAFPGQSDAFYRGVMAGIREEL